MEHSQQLTPELIEAELDKQEEEANEDFDNWFKDVISSTDDKNKDKSELDKMDEELNQRVDENMKQESVNEETNTNEQESVNEETNTNELTISEVDTSSKPKPVNVEIKHHHKHRSRKTELSQSLPPKQPTIIKETETGKVEVGTKKAKSLKPEEIEQKIYEAKQKLTTTIEEQVNEMEANGNCRKLDMIDYTPGSENYTWFKNYILNPLSIPSRITTRLSLNEYINSVTKFRYNCFDSPNESMMHPIPERVILANKLNKIFNHKFINPESSDYHFADLDKQVMEYISRFKDDGTLMIEYMIPQRFIGKLIMALNSDVELALRDNTKPTLNSQFKQVIIHDIQTMKYIQNQQGKLYTSWKTFIDNLLGVGSENLIYVLDTYRNLGNKLLSAYKTDFLIETLFANCLRCYLPSIAMNYFYAVKSVYIIARLLSIYASHGFNKNKSLDEIANDLYVIASSGVMMYENKNFIYKQAPRSMPKYDKPISQETQMYILNHLLTGGQYYLLKMFEECLPSLANDLVSK